MTAYATNIDNDVAANESQSLPEGGWGADKWPKARLAKKHGRPETTLAPLNVITTQVYDTSGRPVAFIDAFGNPTTTVYDSRGRVTGVIDIFGEETDNVHIVAHIILRRQSWSW